MITRIALVPTVGISFIIIVFCGILGFHNWERITFYSEVFVEVLSIAGLTVIAAGAFGVLYFVLGFIDDQRSKRRFQKQKQKAQLDELIRRANTEITVADDNQQVHITTFNGYTGVENTPIHLQGSGGRWFAFNEMRRQLGEGTNAEPHQLEAGEKIWPKQITLNQLINKPTIHNVVLGMDRNGDPVAAPLEKFVHMAFAGSTGSGKSGLQRAIVEQVLTSSEPAKVLLGDMGKISFGKFTGHPRLLYDPISDPDKMLKALEEIDQEVDKRLDMFQRYPEVQSHSEYTEVTGLFLPIVLIFIDEFLQMADANPKIMKLMKIQISRCRKVGVFYGLGSTDWKAESVNTTLRNNFSTRVQFYAQDPAQSKVLLNSDIAMTLTDPGQAYVLLPGQRDAIKMLAPMVDNVPLLGCGSSQNQPVTDDDKWCEIYNRTGIIAEASEQVFGDRRLGGRKLQKLKEYFQQRFPNVSEAELKQRADVFREAQKRGSEGSAGRFNDDASENDIDDSASDSIY